MCNSEEENEKKKDEPAMNIRSCSLAALTLHKAVPTAIPTAAGPSGNKETGEKELINHGGREVSVHK